MRGEISVTDIRQAVVVLDLALGGVHAELGDMPFDWFAAPKPQAPKPMQVMSVEERPQAMGTAQIQASVKPQADAIPVAAPSFQPLTSSSPKQAAQVAPVRKPVASAVQMPGEVWREGEPGGVVMLLNSTRPEMRSVMLARAMLAAVGMGDLPLGWVGYEGGADGKTLHEALSLMEAKKVLVLGQAPLGALLGRSLGVEGWHAAGQPAIEGLEMPVGVTYPLELLMKQPLFKRLAWQHLLAWTDAGTHGENKGE